MLQLHEPVVSKPLMKQGKVKVREKEQGEGGVTSRLCNARHSNPGMCSTLRAPQSLLFPEQSAYRDQ